MRAVFSHGSLLALLLNGAGPALAAQAPASVFLADYTWTELRDAIAAGTTTALVVSGSVEESGPHLVLGKHDVRARYYAERIARELGHTLVAPIVPVAPAGASLDPFPGTIEIRPQVFADYNADIVRSLARAGFKYVFLLGDHEGDQAPLQALAPRLDRELRPRGTRVYFIGDGFLKARNAIEALAAQRGLHAAGHGGLWDTAELWAIDSTAVRPSLFAPGDLSGSGRLDARGVAGDPTGATTALGKEFADIRVRDAVAEIRAILARP